MVKLFHQEKTLKNEIIKFEQLNIDLSNLTTNTIKIQKSNKLQQLN